MDIDFADDKELIKDEKLKAYEDIMLIIQMCNNTLWARETLSLIESFLKYNIHKNKVLLRDGTDDNQDLLWLMRQNLINLKSQNTGNNKIFNSLIELIKCYDRGRKRERKLERKEARKPKDI